MNTRQRLWRFFWGCYIVFLFIVICLPVLQSAALNSGGSARLFGINLAPPISFFARTSSKAGKVMGWDSLANLYYGPDGPIVRDPLYHSAWPYWGAPLLVWGVGSILAVGSLLLLKRFLRHFFFPTSDQLTVASSSGNTTLTSSPPATTVAGLWQAIPFLWIPQDTRGLSSTDIDVRIGAQLFRRGVLCAAVAVILGVIGWPRGTGSPVVWLAAVLALLAIFTLKEGAALSTSAGTQAHNEEIAQAELERQLIVMEATKQSAARDLQHQIDVITLQQTHERRMKNLERWHQRLLVDRQQPHELNLKAIDLTLALAQMVAVAKSEDKFEKYQTIFRRLQKTTDATVSDIQQRTLDPEEAAERIETVRLDLAKFAQKLQYEL